MRVRAWAALLALGALAGEAGAAKRGLEGYVEGLVASDPARRAAAAAGLRELGWRAFPLIPYLLPLLGDPRPAGAESPRDEAARALAAIGPLAVEELVDALRWPDYEVRTRAAWALGAMKANPAVNALIAALADETSDVRAESMTALAALRDPRAVAPIVAVLGNAQEQPWVRRRAALALGELGNVATAAIDPLIAALEEGVDASGALTKITGQNFGNDVGAWRNWRGK